jgi:hypothetical protein
MLSLDSRIALESKRIVPSLDIVGSVRLLAMSSMKNER